MEADRWRRVKAIFSDAAELPGSARRKFLDNACDGDAELRAEVDRLLAQAGDTATTDIFDRPARPRHALEPNTLLGGRFRIVRFVGRGGMGEVYEAGDQDLGGRVALKILRPELTEDPEFLGRFRREIQIARQVTHQNVCRVFDVGYDQRDGARLVFLTMEFLDGETLSDRLRRQERLPLDEAAPLVRQIAEGIGALHEQGVVHRDLKPGNVLVVRSASGGERAVVSDFGLARAVASAATGSLTATGNVMGTPDYMAPEQLLGRPLTPATDIYALGLIMYEMVTGRKPFPGGRQIENAVQRVVEEPAPPKDQSQGITPEWNQLILRCLERNPEDRPKSAAEVAAALGGAAPPRRAVAWPRLGWIAAAGVLGMILAGFPLTRRFQDWMPSRGDSSRAPRNLALLPLKVLGDEPELRVFALGLTETITSRLSQFEDSGAALLVVPASEVRSQGVQTAGEARKKFQVSAAVEGTLQSQGDRVRLLLTVVDTQAMRQLETIRLEDQRANALRLQDSAVTRLANALDVRLQPKYAREQQQMSPIEPGAYEYYVQARGYLQRSDQMRGLESALTLLRHALELDPKFAPAHSGLGRAYFYQYNLTKDPKLLEAAFASSNRALALNPDLPEPNIAIGRLYYATGRHEEALRAYEKAISVDGRNHEAYQGLAQAYLGLKQYDKAEATYLKAISLRPSDWSGYKALGLYYYERENYGKAAENFARVVELTPDNAEGFLNLGAAQSGMQDWDAAVRTWTRALEIDPDNGGAISNLGKVYLDRGETAKAIEAYRKAIGLDRRSYRSWGQLGRAYSRQGDRTRANEAFGKALDLLGEELLVNPRNFRIYSSLAFYRVLMGRKDFGAPLDRALELAPDNADLLERAAEIWAAAGDRRKAARFLDRALEKGVPMQSVMRSEYLKELRPAVRAAK